MHTLQEAMEPLIDARNSVCPFLQVATKGGQTKHEGIMLGFESTSAEHAALEGDTQRLAGCVGLETIWLTVLEETGVSVGLAAIVTYAD